MLIPMLTRDQLRALIDALPEEQLADVAMAVEQATDPVLRAVLLST